MKALTIINYYTVFNSESKIQNTKLSVQDGTWSKGGFISGNLSAKFLV